MCSLWGFSKWTFVPTLPPLPPLICWRPTGACSVAACGEGSAAAQMCLKVWVSGSMQHVDAKHSSHTSNPSMLWWDSTVAVNSSAGKGYLLATFVNFGLLDSYKRIHNVSWWLVFSIGTDSQSCGLLFTHVEYLIKQLCSESLLQFCVTLMKLIYIHQLRVERCCSISFHL